MNLNLFKIPKDIKNLSKLENLDLRQNSLANNQKKELKKEFKRIEKLKTLKTLNLSENSLIVMPIDFKKYLI